MTCLSWTPLFAAENPTLSVDLADAVAKQGGSVISGASVTVTVLRGADPAPELLIPNVCNVTGSVVSFQKTAGAGVAGTSYAVQVTAVMAAGGVIVDTFHLFIRGGKQ